MDGQEKEMFERITAVVGGAGTLIVEKLIGG